MDYLISITPSSVTRSDQKCRRGRPRAIIARTSTIRPRHAGPLDVSVEDLSKAGFRFSTFESVEAGTLINVGLAGAGRANAQVAWRNKQLHGCVFIPPLSTKQLKTAFSHSVQDPAVVLLPLDVSPPNVRSNLQKPLGMLAQFAQCFIVFALCIAGWVVSAAVLRWFFFLNAAT